MTVDEIRLQNIKGGKKKRKLNLQKLKENMKGVVKSLCFKSHNRIRKPWITEKMMNKMEERGKETKHRGK